MNKKPHVLLVNDDGIEAEGLAALYEAIKDMAEVSIFAPASQQSGKGLSITLGNPIRSESISWQGTYAHKVYGTPADCVKIACTLLPAPPDFILSGINQGCNSGGSVLYSGTIGGVIEGIFRSIPGIAFSCREFHSPRYEIYAPYIRSIFEHYLEVPIPQGTLINVNFPIGKQSEIRGIRYATQGQGRWIEKHESTCDGHHHFSATWHEETGPHESSDIALLNRKYVTVSPLRVVHLTDMGHFSMHKEAFDQKFDSLSFNKNKE